MRGLAHWFSLPPLEKTQIEGYVGPLSDALRDALWQISAGRERIISSLVADWKSTGE